MPPKSPAAAPAEPAAPVAADAPAPRSMASKVKVLAFIAVVIVAECVIAYMYLPSASDTAAMAGAALQEARARQAPDAATAQEEELSTVGQVELDLGQFSVTAYQPASNTTLRIDFHLFGTVAAEDEKEFLRRMQDNLHRFREQVIVTVRSADVTDLTDAGLGLLKRKIQEKTNQTLGKPLLRVVIFSDFSFIEQ